MDWLWRRSALPLSYTASPPPARGGTSARRACEPDVRESPALPAEQATPPRPRVRGPRLGFDRRRRRGLNCRRTRTRRHFGRARRRSFAVFRFVRMVVGHEEEDTPASSNDCLSAGLEEDLDRQHQQSDDYTGEHRHREVPSGESGATAGQSGPESE